MSFRAAGAALLVLVGTLAACGPAGAASAPVGLPSAHGGARAPANPLDEARRAAAETSFVGVMQVRWRDGSRTRVERVTVRAERGSLVFTGGTQLVAAPTSERMVRDGGSWDLLWPAGLGPEPRPDAGGKYRIETRQGQPVAGLPATVYDISRHGRLRERLHLHTETSLLLSREQFDDRGAMLRSVGFEVLTLRPAQPVVPPAPAEHERRVPTAVPASAVAVSLDGYQRLGVYRRSDVVQTLYSDGLYDLSVFQQQGRLRRGDLPEGGAPVEVAGRRGWRYSWPGGNLVIWEAAGAVFTAVGDAPLDDILLAARAVPAPPPDASFWVKLRAACATLVQPLGR